MLVRSIAKYDSSREGCTAGWIVVTDEVESLRRPAGRVNFGVESVVVEVADEGVPEIDTGGERGRQPAL